MFTLLLDGAVVARSSSEWKSVTYRNITVSTNEGVSATLDCSPAVYDQAASLILKSGSYVLGLSARAIQGKTIFRVESVSAKK